MLNRRLAFFATALVWTARSAAAAAAGSPYTVEVWSDARFGPDGRLQQLQVADAEKLPPAFVERVQRQLANARIPPVKDDSGAAASFSTGIHLAYQVSPGEQGGTVRLLGMKIAPRPLRRYTAPQAEPLPPDTPLSVKVRCEVGIDGRCGAVKVVEATGTSDALRRWAVASLRGWEFEPQRVGDRPVPGEVEVELTLTVVDTKPADFRDPTRL